MNGFNILDTVHSSQVLELALIRVDNDILLCVDSSSSSDLTTAGAVEVQVVEVPVGNWRIAGLSPLSPLTPSKCS